MVRKFPPFRSERKKRSTSEGTPQFPNGISGKLPYHLTSNRNFRIFWPNGKHPESSRVVPVPLYKSAQEGLGTITLNMADKRARKLPIFRGFILRHWSICKQRIAMLDTYTCRGPFLVIICAWKLADLWFCEKKNVKFKGISRWLFQEKLQNMLCMWKALFQLRWN